MGKTPEKTDALPTSGGERILAPDALRGVAVLGILLINIIEFGLPGAYLNPANAGGTSGASLRAWIATSFFFEGTMRGLFTLLFGAGVVLYTSRLERAGLGLASADLYFRRNLWLIAFGLFNAYVLLFDGDILFYYGLAGLVLYVFRNLPVHRLLLFAIPLLCVPTIVGTSAYVDFQDMQAEAGQVQVLQAQGRTLTTEQQQVIDDFHERLEYEKPTAETQNETVQAMREGYAAAFALTSGPAFDSDTFCEYLGMMLLGMAFMKSGVLTTQWSYASYWRMLAVGWTIGCLVNAFEISHQLRNDFDANSMLSAEYITYDLGRVPLTLGHLSFIMLLIKGGWFRGAFRVLASVGQMALTNYLAHSVICLFVFTGAGLALYGQLERYQLYFVVVGIWAMQLAWSPWWLKRFRFGPAEWLWRSLTHWHRQPLTRAGKVGVT
jgi:uncharacterized protein